MCGNPVAAITDPISDVLGTSGGGGGILGAVEDVGQAIGSAGESIDKAITQPIGQGLSEVDKFVNREIPGGWILPAAAAVAATTGYVDPSLLAAEGAGAGAFTGATETGLATLAGEGALADTVGAALLSGAAETAAAEAVTQALPYTIAADAANLAASGFDAATIAQNLTATGVDSFVAADVANLAAQGLSEAAIAQNIAQGYTAAELAGSGISSTLPAVSKGLTAGQAVQAARLGMGLLGQQQRPQPQQQQMMIGGRQTNPYGGVDYSGLLNLLQPRMASRNPNSLLG